MQLGLAQANAARTALTAASQQLISAKQVDSQAVNLQLTTANAQRPAQWREATNSKVWKEVKDVMLETVKDWFNTAALVMTFTPLCRCRDVAGSAAIAVIQGNYLEAAITVVCILPMTGSFGASAEEAIAGEESVASRDPDRLSARIWPSEWSKRRREKCRCR